MKEISTQQLIHKLPASILSKMPHLFEERTQCVSRLDEIDANGAVYKINARGDIYYYIPAGANIKPNTDFEAAQTFELVRGALVINGKPTGRVTFPMGKPHGTDAVGVDTIIKVINERLVREAEHRQKFHKGLKSIKSPEPVFECIMPTPPTHSK